MKALLLKKALLLMSIVALVTVLVPLAGCGETATLTLSTDKLPAGGGSVKVTYKTDGYLGSVGWTLTSNPPLSGFPIVWTGNKSDSITTFTLSNVPSGTTVVSKSVSVP
jgi:hypothetical protein